MRSYDDAMLDDELLELLGEEDLSMEQINDYQIKIDLEKGLELVWMWGAVLCFFGVLIIGFMSCDDPRVRFSMAIYPGVAMLVFIALYAMTDNYYILDFDERKLLYHHKFLFFQGVKQAARFGDLEAVVVEGRYQSTDSGSWWEHSLCLVARDGKILRLTDREQEKRELYNDICEKVAEHIDIDAHTCPEESCLQVRYDSKVQQVEIIYEALPETTFNWKIIVGVVGVIVLLMVLSIVAIVVFQG